MREVRSKDGMYSTICPVFMISQLSIERINADAPYKVEKDEVTGSYDFVTDVGVHITIYFDEDFMITTGESYQLIIGNANNRKSPRDAKLQKTVLAIVEEFFYTNQAAMLYICETGDGKQGMRSRLFSYWFEAYEYNSRYSLHTTCVKDEEGVTNFAALIIRNDNPLIVEIVNEFMETARALQQKP